MHMRRPTTIPLRHSGNICSSGAEKKKKKKDRNCIYEREKEREVIIRSRRQIYTHKSQYVEPLRASTFEGICSIETLCWL